MGTHSRAALAAALVSTLGLLGALAAGVAAQGPPEAANSEGSFATARAGHGPPPPARPVAALGAPVCPPPGVGVPGGPMAGAPCLAPGPVAPVPFGLVPVMPVPAGPVTTGPLGEAAFAPAPAVAAWGLYVRPYASVLAVQGRTVSAEPDYSGNVFDRQTPLPRPGAAAPPRRFTTVAPGLGPWRVGGQADAWQATDGGGWTPDYLDFAPTAAAADVRGDAVSTSAQLTDPQRLGFVPALIPVRGNPTFGLPGSAAVRVANTVGTHVFLDESVSTQLTTIRLFTQVAGLARADGASAGSVPHLYGQVGGFVVGKGDTFFSDPRAFPNTLDQAGPNALTYTQRNLVGFLYGVFPWPEIELVTGVSLEDPKVVVIPPDTDTTYNTRSRIPDACAQVRLTGPWGHVQVASILRGIGIDNQAYTTGTGATEVRHPSAFVEVPGWGVQATGMLRPFADWKWLDGDLIGFGGVHGRGLSSLSVDLQPLNVPDAVFDDEDELRALPLSTFFLSYTHLWPLGLRSTVVYSQAELGTFDSPALTQSTYCRGQYMAANLIYEFVVPNPNVPAQPGRGFAGIEYLYGRKELLDGNSGSARRVQVTVGTKF